MLYLEQVAEIGRCGGEEAAELGDAVRWSFGTADPVVEVHAARAFAVVVGDFVLGGEAGGLEKFSPAAEAMGADVRCVAQLLNVVELGVEGIVFGAVVIYDDDFASGFCDTRHFADGGGVVGEVVRGETNGDDVECRVWEGKFFCGALFCGDIGEPTLGGVLRGLEEHGFGEVVGDDFRDVRCEGERGMAGSGGDVEDVIVGTGSGEGDESLKGGLIAVADAGGVGGGGGSELGLDFLVDFLVGFGRHDLMLDAGVG